MKWCTPRGRRSRPQSTPFLDTGMQFQPQAQHNLVDGFEYDTIDPRMLDLRPSISGTRATVPRCSPNETCSQAPLTFMAEVEDDPQDFGMQETVTNYNVASMEFGSGGTSPLDLSYSIEDHPGQFQPVEMSSAVYDFTQIPTNLPLQHSIQPDLSGLTDSATFDPILGSSSILSLARERGATNASATTLTNLTHGPTNQPSTIPDSSHQIIQQQKPLPLRQRASDATRRDIRCRRLPRKQQPWHQNEIAFSLESCKVHKRARKMTEAQIHAKTAIWKRGGACVACFFHKKRVSLRPWLRAAADLYSIKCSLTLPCSTCSAHPGNDMLCVLRVDLEEVNFYLDLQCMFLTHLSLVHRKDGD